MLELGDLLLSVYKELKDAAPLVGAAALTFFGVLQWRIAADQRRIALFRERFGAFKAVRDHIDDYLQPGDFVGERSKGYEPVLKDCRLLFGRSATSLLEKVEECCHRVRSASIQKRGDAGEWRQEVEQARKDLRALLPRIERVMGRRARIDQL